MEEFELTNECIVTVISPEDVLDMKEVFYTTWLATYPNENTGITVQDIEHRFRDYFTSESIEEAKEKIATIPENESFLVAKEHTKVVGVCRIVRSETENRLQAIYVLPDYQGRGIGYKLWERAKQTFDNGKPIYVALADYNMNARKFYEKIGFVDTGKRWVDEKFIMQSGNAITEMEMVFQK